ncbi:putative protein [Arabidopsis thaliana]|nr:putative protein [Arabidopsis thaliana]
MTDKEESNHSSEVGAVRSLQETPTWALATVCFFFIAVSICLERLINLLSTRLKKNRKTSLLEAVEKLKSVLMVLGFMSLMLNVTEGEVSKICIPIKYANRMLPCRKTIKSHNDVSEDDDDDDGDNHDNSFFHQCSSKGKTSLISEEGLTQLSYFFFVLACMHILCNLAILLLGMAKFFVYVIHIDEKMEFVGERDPNSGVSSSKRQFYNSVAKVDYLTLRHGFIFAHVSSNNAFNFQNYIQRSLHEDFKTVVGISPLMWLTVVIFMLLDVSGWRVYFYMSFVPLIIVLVIGTKLEMIVAKMAVTIKENNSVIRGTPLVESNDTHFWFSNPRFLLSILHYTLFLNTFEMAFIVWITWQFGINSCYHDNQGIIITRLDIMIYRVTVQFLSSYITLPLYAIVTQMGSSYKRAILEEQLANVLRHWQGMVRDKKKTIQTPDTDNNSNNNNGDIDSGESPVQTEVASEFRFSGRQSPILQEIQIQEKTER